MTRADKLRQIIVTAQLELDRIERREGVKRTSRAAAKVLRDVSLVHGVSIGQIVAHGRTRAVVRARQEAAWGLRRLDLSYPEIGRILNRDHTTVMHAVRAEDQRRRPTTSSRPNLRKVS